MPLSGLASVQILDSSLLLSSIKQLYLKTAVTFENGIPKWDLAQHAKCSSYSTFSASGASEVTNAKNKTKQNTQISCGRN